MTNDQIRAELRRSACEDANPFFEVEMDAWRAVVRCELEEESFRPRNYNDFYIRTIFLIVAEALE